MIFWDMEARAGGAGAAGAGAAAAAGAGDGASGGQCEHGIGSRVACRAADVKPSVRLESGEEDLEYKDKAAEGAGGRVGVLWHCRALAELHFDFARSSGPSSVNVKPM